MSKKGRKIRGRTHAVVHTIMCDWCGERRETSRGDTSTCGDRCRARMCAYVRHLGYRPDGIVGPFTAKDAIDQEIGRLIRQEQRRREEKTAYLQATGTLPPR